ncbi:hypothetical protein MESS4_50058 [Mesorhizobium sp. STM 4661]|nr:hypothetical protein MESS4_50058 [Mesorhizobium sp. STM 4661]
MTSVSLDNGDRLEVGIVVNSAAMAGLVLPVEPRKRNVFVFEARDNILICRCWSIPPASMSGRKARSISLAAPNRKKATARPTPPISR